jgi:hypothetical protein
MTADFPFWGGFGAADGAVGRNAIQSARSVTRKARKLLIKMTLRDHRTNRSVNLIIIAKFAT